ncbi:MAG: tRNA(Ile)(2)-agmatinylcytidine synthase, partial [Thermoplasmata archaeon]|nr:tRNA(Ile)(2)-agmatinylcytidine synthase [Thermoplasmata archaeon]
PPSKGGGTIWVGVDDTDSPKGGCTTFVLTELIALARRNDLDLIGEPRLVRLNPNIPWRTRGNAALSARVGHGRGRRTRLGEIEGAPVWSYRRGGPLTHEERAAYLEEAWTLVLAAANAGDDSTDPALVATDRRLPASVYWNAVRSVVDVADVRRELEEVGAWFRSSGSERGLVGAAASVAWPGRRPTWEVIAYRDPTRWGTPRAVDPSSVRAVQRAFPHLFLCYDARTRRTMVAPHTPCPILFGLRSTDPASAMRALPRVRSEPIDRFVQFRTNQGSGDHLAPRGREEWPPLTSGSLRGSVASAAAVLRGGHVRFEVARGSGDRITCLAYEPTKTLPRVARELLPGDQVRVWGSRGADTSIHLEGIEVVRWARFLSSKEAPLCPACHRRTESTGRQRAYRCRACGTRLPPEAARPRLRQPGLPTGIYHPTPSARRHLAIRAPEN